jgi:ankyrin repeat protein
MDLYTAASKGTVDQVQEALDNGADINDQDYRYDRTPLSWAAEKGNKGVVELLLQKDNIDLNSKDNNGQTPLSWAAEKGNKEVVELLLIKGGITLHTLIREREESLVRRLLLDAKYDVNTKDSLGRTPLHIAISSRNVEIAIFLISFNATDINLKDNDGISPLDLAIQIECPGLIKSLLEKSALTKDIMVDKWRRAYGKEASDIVMLSERESREKSVCFIAEEEFLDKSAQVSTEGGTDRRLL